MHDIPPNDLQVTGSDTSTFSKSESVYLSTVDYNKPRNSYQTHRERQSAFCFIAYDQRQLVFIVLLDKNQLNICKWSIRTWSNCLSPLEILLQKPCRYLMAMDPIYTRTKKKGRSDVVAIIASCATHVGCMCWTSTKHGSVSRFPVELLNLISIFKIKIGGLPSSDVPWWSRIAYLLLSGF